MNNDLTCSCSCTPDSTPTDTSPDFYMPINLPIHPSASKNKILYMEE